jgi:cysteine desulfurase
VQRIYLDFNASTPVDERVAAIVSRLLVEPYGNPSSLHWASAQAKAILADARTKVASLLGARPDEIVFTSGGSESSNAAIKGAVFARGVARSHVVTTAVEHPATLESVRFLERLGARVTIAGVDGTGRVDPDEVGAALTPDTALVTVMHANNETGTIQPVRAIADRARARGVLLHVDAAQSAGKIPVKVDDLGIDLGTIAGHKLYAPKGVGALYIRRGTAIEPLIHGGGHESGRRAGTESLMLAAALGEACSVAEERMADRARIERLRDRLHDGLVAKLRDRVVLNGHPTERLPNTLNVSFVGSIGSEVLARLEGVAASTGSACHEGAVKLSPVLAAMGVPPEIGRGAVRFSLGRGTTEQEIDHVLSMFVQA